MWLASLLTPANVLRVVGGLLGATGFVVAYVVGWNAYTTPMFVIGIGAILVSLAIDGLFEARTRREAQAFAERFGWVYHESLSGLLAPLRSAPFDVPDASYTHVVTGTYGGLTCYDGVYNWHVRIDDAVISGKHRVAVVRLPDTLPRVKLIPEGLSAKVAKALGGKDRDLESAVFNRTWRVIAENPKVAHDILSPRVLERLNSLSTRAPMVFEAGLAVRIDDDAEGIGSLAERLGGLIAVATFLPQHTVEDYGRRANSPGPLPSVEIPGALTGGYRPDLAQLDAEHARIARPRKNRPWSSPPATQGDAPR